MPPEILPNILLFFEVMFPGPSSGLVDPVFVQLQVRGNSRRHKLATPVILIILFSLIGVLIKRDLGGNSGGSNFGRPLLGSVVPEPKSSAIGFSACLVLGTYRNFDRFFYIQTPFFRRYQ